MGNNIMNIVNNAIYIKDIKEIEIISPQQVINSDDGYDGFGQILVTFNPVDIDNVDIYIGDYTNNDVTITNGSKDKYYRRIYGV